MGDEKEEKMSKLRKFQQDLYDRTLHLVDRFEIALEHTSGTETDKVEDQSVPKVTMDDIKSAHRLFHDGYDRLKMLFLSKLSLQRDPEFTDLVDRNLKFEELMVSEISNVYKQCGVPVDIVGDGQQEVGLHAK